VQPQFDTDPSRRRTWQAFFEAHAAVVPVLEAEMVSEHGFNLRWYDVLLQLAAAPDRRLSMGELSDAVVITKGGLTKLVDRMAQAGLVVREQREGDRRVTPVRLTDAGWAAYQNARRTHHRGVAENFLDLMTADELAVLAPALERVRDRAG
jgi:DNA-binding MarR family transcriptional regulator